MAAKHHRLYDEIMHLHKSELMKIRNKKAHQTEMNALGISGIAAMEQIENEELEEEGGARRAAAIKVDDPLNDIEYSVDQEIAMMMDETGEGEDIR
jgi:hypothetical protein